MPATQYSQATNTYGDRNVRYANSSSYYNLHQENGDHLLQENTYYILTGSVLETIILAEKVLMGWFMWYRQPYAEIFLNEVVKLKLTFAKLPQKWFNYVLGIGSLGTKQTRKLFADGIAVGVNLTYLPTKLLLQTVKVGSKFGKQATKVFFEAIKVFIGGISDFLLQENIDDLLQENSGRIGLESAGVQLQIIGKTLGQTFKVGSQLIYAPLKLLLEAIKVGSEFTKQTTRVFTQNVLVGNTVTTLLLAIKVFVEGVKVVAGLTYLPVKLFLETVKAGAELIYKIPGAIYLLMEDGYHLLQENGFYIILEQSQWIFVKIFNEIAKVGQDIKFLTTRILTEVVKVVDSIINGTTRVFSEILKVGSNLASIGVFYKVLYETVIGGSNLVFQAIIALWERVIVGNVLDKTLSAFKSLFETVKVGVFNSTTLVSIRVFTEQVIVGNVVATVLASYKLLVEAVKVGQELTRQTGRVFGELVNLGENFYIKKAIQDVFTEAVKIGDTIGSFTIGKLFVVPVKIGNFLLNQSSRYLTYLETVKVGSEQLLMGIKTLVERLLVGTAFSTLLVADKILTEIVKVVDTFTRTWTLSRIYNEVVLINGAVYNQAARILSEAFKVGNWIGDFMTEKIFGESVAVGSNFVLDNIAKMFYETVKVVQTVNFRTTRVFSQVIKVGSQGIAVGVKVLSEALAVADQFIRGALGKMLYEHLIVRTGIVRVISRVFTQIVKVTGYIAQMGTSVTYMEGISIVPLLGKFTIGKLLKETVVLGWAKAKLVMNGIEVGLWKPIARAAYSAWTKIKRQP